MRIWEEVAEGWPWNLEGIRSSFLRQRKRIVADLGRDRCFASFQFLRRLATLVRRSRAWPSPNDPGALSGTSHRHTDTQTHTPAHTCTHLHTHTEERHPSHPCPHPLTACLMEGARSR